jgi:hypothetical protein
MLRLAVVIYIFLGPTLAGAAIVAALTMGLFDTASVLAAAVAGFVLALPASWVVAKQIDNKA